VLHRVVDTARDVAGARYAAPGVIGVDGLLEQFKNVGLDEETVQAIGEFSKGRGVLGALIEDPKPIRLTRIADDPRSSGFPDSHPPMTSFLGVPIRNRDSVFGNLYLTDRIDGGLFTPRTRSWSWPWLRPRGLRSRMRDFTTGAGSVSREVSGISCDITGAEDAGFEPARACTQPAFQVCAWPVISPTWPSPPLIRSPSTRSETGHREIRLQRRRAGAGQTAC